MMQKVIIVVPKNFMLTTMKALITLCLLPATLLAGSGNLPDKKDLKDMIAICNSFTFLDLYKSDAAIIPAGYRKVYTSGTFGMDNRYQVYKNNRRAVIHFRGSTDKQVSWLENIYAAMIPAQGTMTVEGEAFNYRFADDTAAAVHAGYALGLAFMRHELIDRIQVLNNDDIYDIILTGHSQGGAIANMAMAWLNEIKGSEISEKNQFRTYAFAAPMTGNQAFVNEYNRKFCNMHLSYNIVNVADPIPTFPITYNDSASLKNSFWAMLFDKESFSVKKAATEQSVLMLEDKLGQLLRTVSESAHNRIVKKVGDAELPEYKKEFNYKPIGNRIEIEESPYPRILKDSTILKNDSLMRVYPRDRYGNFTDDKLYKKAGWGWQHKPYNYYVTILRMYFPHEYARLDKKYLKENL
jgi:hypothetical protein